MRNVLLLPFLLGVAHLVAAPDPIRARHRQGDDSRLQAEGVQQLRQTAEARRHRPAHADHTDHSVDGTRRLTGVNSSLPHDDFPLPRELPSPRSPEAVFTQTSPSPRCCLEACKIFMKLAASYGYDAVCDIPIMASNAQALMHHTFDASVEELRHGDWRTALTNTLCIAADGCSEAFLLNVLGCVECLADSCMACALVAGTGVVLACMPYNIARWCHSWRKGSERVAGGPNRQLPWYKAVCSYNADEKDAVKEILRNFQETYRQRRLTSARGTEQRREAERRIGRRFPRFMDWSRPG